MIVYSVTVAIDNNIQAEWLDWMRSKHIPDVMNTGYFQEYHMHRLLDPLPDENSVNYNIQYYIETIEKLDQYLQNEADRLQEEHNSKFINKFVAFRTILEKIP